MPSFNLQPHLLRRSPSSEALHRCYLAHAEATSAEGSTAGEQENAIPQRMTQVVDNFLCGPSPQDVAQQAQRLLIQNTMADAPLRPSMAVRNSVQQSLRKKDPFFVPLTELSAARGDNEVAEALKKSVIRNVSTRLFNLLGEERKNFIASVTSDLNAAFGKVPSDLIGFLSLRGNFTDRQISAIVRDPNALAVQQGLKRFIKQANEKTAQIEQFILEERLSLEMAKLAKTMAFLSVGPVEGMSQRRLGIVALEFPSVAPAGPAAAASADSFATAQDAPYARLIEVLGGLKAIAGGLRLSLGETVANADEAYMEQLTKAVLDRLKPVMLECFAEVDLDAHDRFLHEYPSYVDLRSKQQEVMEKARLTWGTVLEKVIHDQLNQGALARSA